MNKIKFIEMIQLKYKAKDKVAKKKFQEWYESLDKENREDFDYYEKT